MYNVSNIKPKTLFSTILDAFWVMIAGAISLPSVVISILMLIKFARLDLFSNLAIMQSLPLLIGIYLIAMVLSTATIIYADKRVNPEKYVGVTITNFWK